MAASTSKDVLQSHLPWVDTKGPPGVGKTTCVRCLAKELWGRQYRDYVLVMNASDDRGINVVRETIKHFAQKKLPEGSLVKIIILDEADSMTTAAQQSLRRVIENYSETTRFAFAVNNPSKILEAIQSRCTLLRFERLSNKDIIKRLKLVCGIEGVPIHAYEYSILSTTTIQVKTEYGGLEAIAFTADGDMRPALNSLQAAAAGFRSVNEQNVYSICDVPHPTAITDIIKDCLSADLYDAYDRISDVNEGCAETHMRILDGLTGKLQLAALLGRLCQTIEDDNAGTTN